MIQVYSVDEVVHVWSFHAVRRIVHFLLGDLWLAAGGLVQFFPFHAYHAALYLLCHFSYRHHLHLDDLVTTETHGSSLQIPVYNPSQSESFPIPIPSQSRLILTRISFPILVGSPNLSPLRWLPRVNELKIIGGAHPRITHQFSELTLNCN